MAGFGLTTINPYFLKHPEARDRFVAVVSCASEKRNYPSPARLLYKGTLFRLQSEWAERNCNQWVIISALHGIVWPDTVVAPYDLQIKDLTEEDRLQWGAKVRKSLSRIAKGSEFLFMSSRLYFDTAAVPGSHMLFEMPDARFGHRMKWLKSHPILTDEVWERTRSGDWS